MPQITVDHSDRLVLDRRAFAAELHPLVAKTIDTTVDACKTRFSRIEESFIGDGDPAQVMLHLEIGILAGRSTELKTELSEAVLALVRSHATAAPGDRLHLAVDVVDLDRGTYRSV
ncbi:5-carboxymethyl-2-hydroxymuconate Delta-isomerase [Streptacidiphilus albus]|jgi:5-carboxymethyl-2-hydroxymuconate isomerase|uniref:5-carboxymethyl-2-hydroxymuconate Delta-isomerase n=1 Tax=Streptacidiphilus albus TaxID=105425 RepID=UPI00054B918A|nr:hypothetical protein [Streptacidiphilus albus]